MNFLNTKFTMLKFLFFFIDLSGFFIDSFVLKIEHFCPRWDTSCRTFFCIDVLMVKEKSYLRYVTLIILAWLMEINENEANRAAIESRKSKNLLAI